MTSLKKKLSEISVLVTEEEIPDYGTNVDEEHSVGVLTNKNQFGNSFSSVPNFVWIEISLLSNVFLSGFDATVTASTYTTIGNEFQAANLASWITTSYLITSTAFQPLYGSFSDVLGRRQCVFFAIVLFTVGCLGCAIAPTLTFLNLSRALAGVGGGGLLTLATVINSDIVPQEKRGLFQAFQNLAMGLGAVFGASFGGVISDSVGWRWCFFMQIPPAILSLLVGYAYLPEIKFTHPHTVTNKQIPSRNSSVENSSTDNLLQTNDAEESNSNGGPANSEDCTGNRIEYGVSLAAAKIDYMGSLILVLSLSIQVVVLTLGGAELPWTSAKLISLATVGFLLLAYFIHLELKPTTLHPIIPIARFNDLFSILMLAQNFMLGFSSYAYLFALPLLFQFVLGDSPSQAGLRLAIPSLSTPVGGVLTGLIMGRKGPPALRYLVYTGTFVMAAGNFIVLLVKPSTPSRLLDLMLIPANLGQGMAFPSCLFTFVFAFSASCQATSTSTIYLSRSIGGVWGVSCVSAIIQGAFKSNLLRDLEGEVSQKEVARIIRKITKSTDAITSLPPRLQGIVAQDYENAIRLAQLFSSICCTLAFVFCLSRDILNAQPKGRTTSA
ncbi:vacuolar basic amino acid transporter 2 [[Candida] anglica]|uniref:Vacuolar basic amino acid transporter 2 n=1 Tax=[Candida] anglica TaxID=148631 RepID=A0ABP0EGL0_9ASCO